MNKVTRREASADKAFAKEQIAGGLLVQQAGHGNDLSHLQVRLE